MKEKKDIKVGYRFKKSTVEKLKKMAETTGISQSTIIENLINDNIIFTKEELKEMRFCVRSFKIDAEKAQENFPTVAGLIKGQLNVLDTIIGKIEVLQKYYK